MKKFYLPILATVVAGFSAIGQNELYNDGALIHVQNDALIHIDGEFVNKTNGANTGVTENNGLIELTGDFTVDNNTEFKTTATGQRAVKFIGSGDQEVNGDMFTSGTRNFYNLVLDKAVSGATVTLNTDSRVEGSIVWGSGTTANTYSPTGINTLTSNGGNGILRTFVGTSDFELYSANGATDAVAGYAALGSNPTDGYIQTRGAQGSGLGGFARWVTVVSGDYVYPVGTVTNGYNPIVHNFASVAAAPNKIRGLFCDGNTGSVNFAAYFSGGACAVSNQWVIYTCMATGHGYWSFEGDAANTYYTRSYPNSVSLCNGSPGSSFDNIRMIKYSAPIGSVPSGDWTSQVDDVVGSIGDGLLNYSANLCYAGSGIPGGPYQGFSHFQLASDPSNALPVEYLTINAVPIDNQYIRVLWSTAIEIDNAGFKVMRSEDGMNFTQIGWVDGNGNTTTVSDYHFDDHNVIPNKVYYYRLIQVDNDGDQENSPVVSAMITDNSTFSVSEFTPSPANELSRLFITSVANKEITVTLYDAIGQVVSAKKMEIPAGTNAVELNLKTMASGAYYGTVAVGNETYTRKLVITR